MVMGLTERQLLPAVVVMFSEMVSALYAIALLAAVPKYCPPATVAVVTDVTKPLALTVTTGIELDEPKEPTLEFTVASVALVIAVPVLPDKVKSPPVTEIEPETLPQEVLVPSVVKNLPALPVWLGV
jgi:hypothetical protein